MKNRKIKSNPKRNENNSIRSRRKGAKKSAERNDGGVDALSVVCEACDEITRAEGEKERIIFNDYKSPQLSLLFFDMIRRHPDLTPDSTICRSCLEEGERTLQQKQIVRRSGELYYADPYLNYEPILSTHKRLKARARLTGKGVTIAFVDSAFAPHPDVILPTNRILAYYDAVEKKIVKDIEFDFSDEPPAEAWHGTMTASVAAGSGHLSGKYYRGIASNAKLVFVKTMTSDFRIQTPQVINALEWIRDNYEKYGIRIVNLSLGVDESTDSMRHPVIALVEELTQRGVVIVAASGNNPKRPLVPPGSAPSAITVGGYNDHNTVDWSRRELWHSSYGTTPNGVRKPELLGPAIWIAAPILLRSGVKSEAESLFYMINVDDETLMRSIPVLAKETRIEEELMKSTSPLRARSLILERIRSEKLITPSYKHVDGTSFAAPIVSSLAAQMLEADPTLTPTQVKERLLTNAKRIDGISEDVQGYGVVRPDR